MAQCNHFNEGNGHTALHCFKCNQPVLLPQEENIKDDWELAREDFKKITGHNSPEEWAAYDKGREDEQKLIMSFIENWNGETNSELGQLLKKKLNG